MIARPMKTPWYHILLALSEKPLHGYGIQRSVLNRTDNHLRLWPAMLYRSLNRLEDEGLIAPVASPAGEPDDERRQYYALTPRGRERLAEETEMLADWVQAARGLGVRLKPR